jgi:hypothetical protein
MAKRVKNLKNTKKSRINKWKKKSQEETDSKCL